MKNIVMLVFVICSGILTQAQTKPNKNAKHEFHVSGNCEMCKKRIEKAALNVSGVKMADWHLDCGTLHLILNENKTHADSVRVSVARAGHDTDKIKATTETYEKLHSCCKYTRKEE